MTTDEALRTWFLAESDRRDRELAARLSAWQEGRNTARTLIDDAYEKGFAAGFAAVKRAQHQVFSDASLEQARWGPGGREHFADPREDDYQGGPVAPW